MPRLRSLALGAVLAGCAASPSPAPARSPSPSLEQLARQLGPAPSPPRPGAPVAIAPRWGALHLQDAARRGDRLVLLQTSGAFGRIAVVEAGRPTGTVEERHLEHIAVAIDAPVIVAATGEGSIGDLGEEEIVVYGLDGLTERARWRREATEALAISPNGEWIAAGGGGFIDLYRTDGTRAHRRVLVPLVDRDPEVAAVWYSSTRRLDVDDDGTIVAARCDTTLTVVSPSGDTHALPIPWDPPDPNAQPGPCEGEEDEDGGSHCSYVPPHPDLIARFLRRGRRLIGVTLSGRVVEWRSTGPRGRPRELISAGCTDAELRAVAGDAPLDSEDVESERYTCSQVRSAHLAPDGRHVVVQNYEWVSRRFDLRTRRRDVGRVPDLDLMLAPADSTGETVWMIDPTGGVRRWSRALGDWDGPDDVLAGFVDDLDP